MKRAKTFETQADNFRERKKINYITKMFFFFFPSGKLGCKQFPSLGTQLHLNYVP